MPFKTIILVGNDKIGHRLIARLGPGPQFFVLLDASSSWKRVFQLLRKKRISLPLLWKMGWAEFRRKGYATPGVNRIRNSQELLQAIRDTGAQKVYLFRVGLIISSRILSLGIEIFNIHCASLPHYGGLGAIQRALDDEAWEQQATLHRVQASIDSGEMLRTLTYRLDPQLSYGKNEDLAYEAGIQILLDELTAG